MSISGEVPGVPPTSGIGVPAVSGWARALRCRAGRVALAGLIAGGVLLVPGAARAASGGKQAESKQEAAPPPPASGARPKKVSPYAIATRRHMHAAAEAGDRANRAAAVGPSRRSARFRRE
jgi:hypothetical protein